MRKRTNLIKLNENDVSTSMPLNHCAAKKFHRNRLTNALDVYTGGGNSFRTKQTLSSGIVFNGTYPIDDPVSSRFHNQYVYNEYDEDAYDEEEEEGLEAKDNADDDEDSVYDNFEHHQQRTPIAAGDKNNYEDNVKGYSIDELVQNKNIKFNFDKMKAEYDRSFREFDRIVDRKRCENVRTFNIDAPI